MSNYIRGGAGGPRKPKALRTVNVTKVIQPTVEKAMAPGGSQMVPIRPNANAERGGPVGGLQDAQPNRGLRQAGTARRGQDPKAFQTGATPSMAPPTPRPGGRGKAAPVPTAPPRLTNADMATGSTNTSGERALMGHARTSRQGGAISLGPTRHRSTSLPTPRPSFPGGAADNPGGSPTQQPAGGGSMSGVMQGGKGKSSGGGTDLRT